MLHENMSETNKMLEFRGIPLYAGFTVRSFRTRYDSLHNGMWRNALTRESFVTSSCA
jgi:hypothetical protein